MKYFVAIAYLIIAVRLLSAEPPSAVTNPEVPGLSNATVTIPYTELKALWESSQSSTAAQHLPPVAASILSADYTTRWDHRGFEIDCRFVAENLVDTWSTIPLFGPDLRIKSIDPPAVRVISGSDGSAVLLERRQRQEFQIVVFVPADNLNAQATIALPSVAQANFRNGAATGGDSLVIDGLGRRTSVIKPGEAEPLGGERSVTLSISRPDAVGETVWQTLVEALVQPGEVRHTAVVRIAANALSGNATDLTLHLPAVARVLAVEGEDLREWHTGAPQDDRREVRIEWHTARIPLREFQVRYDLPAVPEVTLDRPPVDNENVAKSSWIVVVAEPTGAAVSIAPDGAPERMAGDWVRKLAPQAALTAREVTGKAIVSINWLPRLETRRVALASARYTQRLVVDGGMMVSAGYAIHAAKGGELLLELPETAKVLECKVAALATQPVKKGGTISIPLPVGLSPGAAPNVELTYTMKLAALDPVAGRVVLDLPRTPEFIETIDWQMVLPGAYEVGALEGNAHFIAAENGTVKLRKELCHGEKPSVVLFYKRNDKNS